MSKPDLNFNWCGYKLKNGEGGIRTHDDLRHNCLAGSPVQPLLHLSKLHGGGSRIRTHGDLRHNGFQDRRFRPLSHPTIIIILETILILTHIYSFVKRICPRGV